MKTVMEMRETKIRGVNSAADAGFNGNLRCILMSGARDSK